MSPTRKSYFLIALAIAFFQFALLNQAAAGEASFQPGITISEEYNDNVLLHPDNPEDDFITRILPSIHFAYRAPVWEWDLRYSFDYRYFAEQTEDDDITHLLSLFNHTSIVRDVLFIDVRDEYRRVSLDTARDYTALSPFVNQTDTNDVIVSPYLRFNLSSHTSGTLGYQYRSVWYEEKTAVDKTENAAFVYFVNELSARTVLLAGAKHTRTDTRINPYDKSDIYAGPRYEYADGSVMWLLIGNSWFDSELWGKGSQLGWDAGITHRFVSYTITLNTALSYIDDPNRVQRREDRYVGTFRKEGDRLILTFTAGRWEYRNVLTKRLQETRNGIGGTVSYQITPALRGFYSLNIDRFDNDVEDTYSMLYLNVGRLEYVFPANTILALEYRFTHGYSPDLVNYNLNYDNNRIILEARKLF